MLPRKPNKYMIRFHYCLSLPHKLQNNIIFVYAMLFHNECGRQILPLLNIVMSKLSIHKCVIRFGSSLLHDARTTFVRVCHKKKTECSFSISIIDSLCCDSTRILVQSACQARKALYIYGCVDHTDVCIQVTTLDFLGLCLGGKSLLMPFLGLIHPSSRKELEPTRQTSKH